MIGSSQNVLSALESFSISFFCDSKYLLNSAHIVSHVFLNDFADTAVALLTFREAETNDCRIFNCTGISDSLNS